LKIDIRADIKSATKGLSRVQKKQIPFATSQTLNQLAKELTKGKGGRGIGIIGKATTKTFRKKSGSTGSTKFTQRNFFFDKSTKRELTAYVFWDERNADYMKFQVAGGTRFPKQKSVLVPTSHSRKYLDAYGNFKPGVLDEWFGGTNPKYFKGVPKGAKRQSEGIWERYGRRTKKGGQKIRMVAAFKGNAQYQPLFPFGKITKDYVFSQDNGFARKFRSNLDKALKKAK
jgi:hypothetical protein